MARPPKVLTNNTLLAAALEGLEAQRQRIDEQIASVKAMLGKKSPAPAKTAESVPAAKKPGRRKMTEAARKRIAAAQKKRWAEFRKNKPSAG